MSELHELAVERIFTAPRAVVWRAVTEQLAEWWCPRPWTSKIVALDWRAGGRFAITLHGPDGQRHAIDGVMLDVVAGERFTFTNALDADWHPHVAQPANIVGTFEFADTDDGGTQFRSSARHWSAADAQAHAELGFAQGWGVCADQLGEVARKLQEGQHA